MASTSSTSESTPITQPLPLRFFATRAVALSLFKANLRWRRLTDVAAQLADFLRSAAFPRRIHQDVHDAIGIVFREIQRWGLKHVELFEEPPRGRAHRGEHLRTYYHCLQWRPSRYELDDAATARAIIAAASDWRQLQFIFASAYAFTDLLLDRFHFDLIRLRTFQKQIGGHCLYDLWLSLFRLDDWSALFQSRSIVPNQKLSLCFQFAIRYGYFELVKFLWDRTSATHREYMGLLQWRHVCFSAVHRETVRFLCGELCEMNPQAVARITWTFFYDALYKSMDDEHGPKAMKDNRLKLEFLVENSCPRLRAALLSMENFRVVKDAFRYNQADTFALFLENLEAGQLQRVTEAVDRIGDTSTSGDDLRALRQLMLRRQRTVH